MFFLSFHLPHQREALVQHKFLEVTQYYIL